ncbi:MAG: hypothetical protein NTAFB05_00440 [Nitrobacter sp.]
MHKHATSQPSLSLRIDLAMDARIGPGKIELLEAIADCGSISAAGRAMDMSYKRAWDLVDEINQICGCKVVARRIGGKNGGGTVLTPFGTSLVARYRKIERIVASAVQQDLLELQSDIGPVKKSRARKTYRFESRSQHGRGCEACARRARPLPHCTVIRRQ